MYLQSISSRIAWALNLQCFFSMYVMTQSTRWSLNVPLISWWSRSGVITSYMCHWTGSSVSCFSDKLVHSDFRVLGDGISQENRIEFQGSQRCDISGDIAKTCMCLRLVIREQRPMTPTVMLWVWQVDSGGSELDTIDNLCLQEIKLRADLYRYEYYIYRVNGSY